MKTHQDQVREARIIAANATPGTAKRLPQGYSNVFEKFKSECALRKVIKKEKKVKTVKRRQLSEETMKVGEMSRQGLTPQEIADKTGIKVWTVREKIETFYKYQA